jgi:hypothetical protein
MTKPCNGAGRAIAFRKKRGKSEHQKGNEPDNVRAPEQSGDDKCNREQTGLEKGYG